MKLVKWHWAFSPALFRARDFFSILSGVNPFRLPLICIPGVCPILVILSLFQLDAHLAFFALLASVAHGASSFECTST